MVCGVCLNFILFLLGTGISGLDPTAGSPASPHSCAPPPGLPVDVMLAIDGSGSVGIHEFRRATELLSELIQRLADGESRGLRLGLIQVGESPVLELPLAAGSPPGTALAVLRDLRQSLGDTNAAQAMDLAAKELLEAGSGGEAMKLPRARVLVWVTDGLSSEPMAEAGERLRRHGVLVFVVSTGRRRAGELRAVASQPSRHFLILAEADELPAVAGRICRTLAGLLGPGQLAVTTVGPRAATLTWPKLAVSQKDAYVLEFAPEGGPPEAIYPRERRVLSWDARSLTVRGLQPDTLYRFRLRVRGRDWGALEAKGRTSKEEVGPIELSLFPLSPHSLGLDWTSEPDNITGYGVIYGPLEGRGEVRKLLLEGTRKGVLLEGLSPQTEYLVTFSASYASGQRRTFALRGQTLPDGLNATGFQPPWLTGSSNATTPGWTADPSGTPPHPGAGGSERSAATPSPHPPATAGLTSAPMGPVARTGAPAGVESVAPWPKPTGVASEDTRLAGHPAAQPPGNERPTRFFGHPETQPGVPTWPVARPGLTTVEQIETSTQGVPNVGSPGSQPVGNTVKTRPTETPDVRATQTVDYPKARTTETRSGVEWAESQPAGRTDAASRADRSDVSSIEPEPADVGPADRQGPQLAGLPGAGASQAAASPGASPTQSREHPRAGSTGTRPDVASTATQPTLHPDVYSVATHSGAGPADTHPDVPLPPIGHPAVATTRAEPRGALTTGVHRSGSSDGKPSEARTLGYPALAPTEAPDSENPDVRTGGKQFSGESQPVRTGASTEEDPAAGSAVTLLVTPPAVRPTLPSRVTARSTEHQPSGLRDGPTRPADRPNVDTGEPPSGVGPSEAAQADARSGGTLKPRVTDVEPGEGRSVTYADVESTRRVGHADVAGAGTQPAATSLVSQGLERLYIGTTESLPAEHPDVATRPAEHPIIGPTKTPAPGWRDDEPAVSHGLERPYIGTTESLPLEHPDVATRPAEHPIIGPTKTPAPGLRDDEPAVSHGLEHPYIGTSESLPVEHPDVSNLPAEHPDVSNLPVEHPDVSSLPAEQSNIGVTKTPAPGRRDNRPAVGHGLERPYIGTTESLPVEHPDVSSLPAEHPIIGPTKTPAPGQRDDEPAVSHGLERPYIGTTESLLVEHPDVATRPAEHPIIGPTKTPAPGRRDDEPAVSHGLERTYIGTTESLLVEHPDVSSLPAEHPNIGVTKTLAPGRRDNRPAVGHGLERPYIGTTESLPVEHPDVSNLPAEHPDVSNLPVEHPDVSSLPAEQSNIGVTKTPAPGRRDNRPAVGHGLERPYIGTTESLLVEHPDVATRPAEHPIIGPTKTPAPGRRDDEPAVSHGLERPYIGTTESLLVEHPDVSSLPAEHPNIGVTKTLAPGRRDNRPAVGHELERPYIGTTESLPVEHPDVSSLPAEHPNIGVTKTPAPGQRDDEPAIGHGLERPYIGTTESLPVEHPDVSTRPEKHRDIWSTEAGPSVRPDSGSTEAGPRAKSQDDGRRAPSSLKPTAAQLLPKDASTPDHPVSGLRAAQTLGPTEAQPLARHGPGQATTPHFSSTGARPSAGSRETEAAASPDVGGSTQPTSSDPPGDAQLGARTSEYADAASPEVRGSGAEPTESPDARTIRTKQNPHGGPTQSTGYPGMESRPAEVPVVGLTQPSGKSNHKPIDPKATGNPEDSPTVQKVYLVSRSSQRADEPSGAPTLGQPDAHTRLAEQRVAERTETYPGTSSAQTPSEPGATPVHAAKDPPAQPPDDLEPTATETHAASGPDVGPSSRPTAADVGPSRRDAPAFSTGPASTLTEPPRPSGLQLTRLAPTTLVASWIQSRGSGRVLAYLLRRSQQGSGQWTEVRLPARIHRVTFRHLERGSSQRVCLRTHYDHGVSQSVCARAKLPSGRSFSWDACSRLFLL